MSRRKGRRPGTRPPPLYHTEPREKHLYLTTKERDVTSEKDLGEQERPKTEVAVVEPTASELILLAIKSGLGAEGMATLTNLKNQQEDRQAARDFIMALTNFQNVCPSVRRNVKVDLGAGKAKYSYTDYDYLVATIGPYLRRYGLSWQHTDCVLTDTQVSVETTLYHTSGHSRATRAAALIDQSMRASITQKSGGALMYAKRQSLILCTGVSTGDRDNDGADDRPLVNENQIANIEAKIAECGDKIRVDRFLTWARVDQIGMIKQDDYPSTIAMLQRKIDV